VKPPTKLVIVRRRPDGKLNSTNTRRVRVGCCHERGTCPNLVKWIIDKKYYCFIHGEAFFETHYIEEHQIVRLDSQFREEKPSMSKYAQQQMQII
jgi:hypothetical protein